MLDFKVNRFFMKLFRTSNIEMVKECQSYFSFQLPSKMDAKTKDGTFRHEVQAIVSVMAVI